VQLENEYLRVIVLPEIGGKLASIFSKTKDFELAFQNKENEYKKAEIYDDFGDYDASGFDDAFPTINEGKATVAGKQVSYPNHGEIWSGVFLYKVKEDKIELFLKSSILSYDYKKLISIWENNIFLDYEITNTGDADIPCIWAAHYLVNCHEDMKLILPEGTMEVINVCPSAYLGEVGKLHSYPNTIDCFGEKYELNKIYSQSAGKMEKYYVDGRIKEGMCGIYYPHKDLTYKLFFDKEIMPYLGFWITEGGFRGDYNCALEPANGFYDGIDIAEKENKLYILKPKEVLKFRMQIQIL
jgi:hypothetical protein